MPELQEWYSSGRDRVVPRPERVTRPDWFAFALRFCRSDTDSLARQLRVVPDSHRTLSGARCVCGTEVPIERRTFAKCPNGCRWFITDGETVWAARLPEDPA